MGVLHIILKVGHPKIILTQISEQKRFWCDFYLIIFLNGINWYFDKRSHLNLLLWNRWTKLKQIWLGWSLGGPFSILCPTAPPSIQNGCCYQNVIENGGVTHNFESGPPKDHFNSNFWAKKILMWFLSHNIPKRNKLAEKISQKNPIQNGCCYQNGNFFSCQFLLYCKSKWTQILTAATWQWVV
jgi:hypothetical protein